MTTPGVRANIAAVASIAIVGGLITPFGHPNAAFAQVGAQVGPRAEPDAPENEADPGVQRPDTARRVVAMFDFEEPSNPYPVPRHWVRAQDSAATPHPGFPAFNEPAFDFTTAASGQASVRLPTRGGSTALRLAPGVIPVFPYGDYTIAGAVRTDGITGSRAFLVARLLDQDLKPIPGAEVSSAPISTGGAWERCSVELPGLYENAAFLQIELLLLQARRFAPPPTPAQDRHAAVPEDLDGAAWFDDIGVYQLPRVEIATTAPANIVPLPRQPVIRMIIRDLVGERLDAHVVVRDVDGVVVDRATLPVTGQRPVELTPRLPRLGWYHASLDVVPGQGGERVGHAELMFITVPAGGTPMALAQPLPGDLPTTVERQRFGICADGASAPELAAIPAVVRQTRTGFVTLPVWDAHISRETLAESLAVRGPVLDELLRLRQSVTLVIPSLPSEIARELRVEEGAPLALAQVDSREWFDYLLPVLDRYGQRITRWQVGRIGDDRAFWHPALTPAVARLHDLLAALVPGPTVQVPWRADREFVRQPVSRRTSSPTPHPPARPTPPAPGVAMLVPASFPSGTLQTLLPQLQSTDAEITFIPELPRPPDFGRRAAVIELARRTVELWAGAADAPAGTPGPGFAVDRPWEWVGDRRPQLMPLPELAVWRTLVEHLAGRRIIGELPAARGVRCYILAPLDRSTPTGLGAAGGATPGALVAWNESAAAADAVLNAYLGASNIVLVDVFGNAVPAPRNGDAAGTHTIRLSETPLFIEGADPYLARFVASLALEPDFAPAASAPHEHSVVLYNPWPVPIDGKLQVVPPAAVGAGGRAGQGAPDRATEAGWTVTPSGSIPFFIEPGKSKEVPFTLVVPPGEEAGAKAITIVVRLTAERVYPPLHLPARLELGLTDLDMVPDCQLAPTPSGPDVVVTAAITNRGTASRLLRLDVSAPGAPSRQIPVSELGAGQTVLKRMVIKDAAARLAGKRIRLSLSDAEAADRLNKSVAVP